ncbi:MAG TPA: hypothetical protein DCM57_06575 [Treponema sp.]|nr:hypothetical protein [Treponema sp.]
MNMHLKLLFNDFKKKPWKNIIILAFMTLSVLIASSVVLMLSNLFSSITAMYETSNPPHFLQMHKGELNQAAVDEFDNSFEKLTHSQTVCMIDFYGNELELAGSQKNFSLEDCRLDICFVKQNEKYDVLLDSRRRPVNLSAGEIAVPVILLDSYDIKTGDVLTIRSNGITKSFKVTSFVLDGMMNSTMCSSTRFLISDSDFYELFGKCGETEYIIEAWFSDSSLASSYQNAYEQSSLPLPKDGQAITYSIIFLLSALTDIMTSMVFVLAGILLVVIAGISLHHVILTELTDDIHQIGTMKAIGIPEKNIRGLYLGKIRVLMIAAMLIGVSLSVALSPAVCTHISRTFGSQPLKVSDVILALSSSVLIYLIIILFTRRILSKIKKARVTDLLVRGGGFTKKTKTKDGLRKSKLMPVNLLMGFHEVRKGYSMVFMLMLIVSILSLLPLRTAKTMEHRNFATYMGSPVCDLFLEVEQGENLEARNDLIESLLQKSKSENVVKSYNVNRRVRATSGETSLHIDCGAAAGNGIKYMKGKNPEMQNEIALSVILADELEKKCGDTVSLRLEDETVDLVLCGIYQDVTSGGRTAKTIRNFDEHTSEKYEYQIFLTAGSDAEMFAQQLRADAGNGFSIEDMEHFLSQTLGGVVSRIKDASRLVFFCGIFITICMVLLFMELKISSSLSSLAEKKAMGIPLSAIMLQEFYPVLISGICGMICGIVMEEIFGDDFISVLFATLGLGLKKITFTESLVSCIHIPLLLLSALACVTYLVCGSIKKINPAVHLDK